MAKVDSRSAKCNLGGVGRLSFNMGHCLAVFLMKWTNLTREQMCHLMAGMVSILIVTPLMFMVLDRRDPVILQQEGSYISPSTISGGQKFLLTYKVDEIWPCDGEVAVRIIDSTGRIFPYAVEPTVYRRTLDRTTNVFVKERIAPTGLASGLAKYETEIYRWCNPFQKYIWPIHSKSLKLTFMVP